MSVALAPKPKSLQLETEREKKKTKPKTQEDKPGFSYPQGWEGRRHLVLSHG